MKKRLLAMLVALCILVLPFASCKKNTQEMAVEQGRYVEIDITPPDAAAYNGPMTVEGDTIVFLTYDTNVREGWYTYSYRIHRSTDAGETWETVVLDWYDELMLSKMEGAPPGSERAVYTNSMLTLADGGLLFSLEIYDSYNGGNSTSISEYYIADLNGENVRPLYLAPMDDVNALGDEYTYSVSLIEAAKGTLVARIGTQKLNEDGYFVSDGEYPDLYGIYNLETGAVVAELPQFYTAVTGEDGYVVSFTADQAAVYDFVTGEKKETQPVMHADALYGDWYSADGSLFYLNADGLYHQLAANLPPELVISSAHYSFGSPVMTRSRFFMTGEERFLVLYTVRDAAPQLKKYVYDPDAPSGIEGHMRVLSLRESQDIRQAIFLFCVRHPEIEVTYEYYYEAAFFQEEKSISEEEFLHNLALRMLDGSGPDVLVLDGLPFESYKNQGLLEDIRDLAEDYGTELIAQVVEPLVEPDGSLYALSTHFALPLFFARESEAHQYESLDTLMEAMQQSDVKPVLENEMAEEDWNAYYEREQGNWPLEERPVIDFGNAPDVLDAVLAGSQPALYAGDGLDRQALTTVLRAAGEIVAYRGLMNPMVAVDTADDGYSAGTHDYFGLMRFWEGKAQGGHVLLRNMQYLSNLSFYLNREYETPVPDRATRENITCLFMPGLSEGAYYPLQMLGISGMADNKEHARELLRIAVSADVQQYDFYAGLPVNLSCFEKQLAAVGTDITGKAEKPVYKPNFDAVFDALKTPILPDAYLTDTIHTYGMQYFEGALTLEQAVEAIMDATEMYLAERE